MKKLPIGTRIKFIKTLECGATGDHPAYEYAREGMEGEVVGHKAWEGHMVKTDHWEAPFGAELGKEFVELKD